ncbi:MAG: acetolactate synthase small subunit [Alphaproteobacteria bacterium]|nr:acetolactate synthase small subunit [Alphaproteobacteria bacterium]
MTLTDYTLSIIVDNQPGVLAKVVGLFSGRGYNIESLTVTLLHVESEFSRITIVTRSDPNGINQIKTQLLRVVPVREIIDLTSDGEFVAREVVMVKFFGEGHARREALRIAQVFHADVDDTTLQTFVFTLTGGTKKVESFIDLLSSLGQVEVVRSGVIALSRGASIHSLPPSIND